MCIVINLCNFCVCFRIRSLNYVLYYLSIIYLCNVLFITIPFGFWHYIFSACACDDICKDCSLKYRSFTGWIDEKCYDGIGWCMCRIFMYSLVFPIIVLLYVIHLIIHVTVLHVAKFSYLVLFGKTLNRKMMNFYDRHQSNSGKTEEKQLKLSWFTRFLDNSYNEVDASLRLIVTRYCILQQRSVNYRYKHFQESNRYKRYNDKIYKQTSRALKQWSKAVNINNFPSNWDLNNNINVDERNLKNQNFNSLTDGLELELKVQSRQLKDSDENEDDDVKINVINDIDLDNDNYINSSKSTSGNNKHVHIKTLMDIVNIEDVSHQLSMDAIIGLISSQLRESGLVIHEWLEWITDFYCFCYCDLCSFDEISLTRKMKNTKYYLPLRMHFQEYVTKNITCQIWQKFGTRILFPLYSIFSVYSIIYPLLMMIIVVLINIAIGFGYNNTNVNTCINIVQICFSLMYLICILILLKLSSKVCKFYVGKWNIIPVLYDIIETEAHCNYLIKNSDGTTDDLHSGMSALVFHVAYVYQNMYNIRWKIYLLKQFFGSLTNLMFEYLGIRIKTNADDKYNYNDNQWWDLLPKLNKKGTCIHLSLSKQDHQRLKETLTLMDNNEIDLVELQTVKDIQEMQIWQLNQPPGIGSGLEMNQRIKDLFEFNKCIFDYGGDTQH